MKQTDGVVYHATTRNISYHCTIKQSPYETVYGIKPHREQLTPSLSLEKETDVEVLNATHNNTDETTKSS